MLVVSPYMEKRLARRQRDAVKGRLGKGRFDTLAKELAALHRAAQEAGLIITYLNLEGTLRAALRADLCLQGWRWRDANFAAITLMDEVHRRLKVERPSWNEAQPEHVALPGLQIERTRCAKCHKRLPEGHKKFCSRICATTYHDRLTRIREADEAWVSRMAARWI